MHESISLPGKMYCHMVIGQLCTTTCLLLCQLLCLLQFKVIGYVLPTNIIQIHDNAMDL